MASAAVLLHHWLVMAPSLNGKRILLTRAAAQMAVLREAVRRRGARAICFPCLEVQLLPGEIRRAWRQLPDFPDILFTSVNGVHGVADVVDAFALRLSGRRVAAVGRATAEALRQRGVEPAIVPDRASQEGLLHAYRTQGLPERLLFFRAREGRQMLASALAEAGVRVETVSAYRTVCPGDDAGDVIRLLEQNAVDAVLLGSPKAARHYVRRIGDAALADRPVVAVLSPAIGRAAEEAGLHVQLVAEDASFESLLDALDEYFDRATTKT